MCVLTHLLIMLAIRMPKTIETNIRYRIFFGSTPQ